ncbi:MAG: HAD family hydrolase [Pseudomonadota bacterium]
MTDVSAILFDKDGTLFDFHATWASWAARFIDELACGDADRANRLANAVGFDFPARAFSEDSPLISATPGDIATLLLPHLPGASPSGVITHMNRVSAHAPQVPAAPLRPLMEDLRARGLRLGVVTNDAEKPARTHLETAGILDLMEGVFGCDSGFGAKPLPDMPLAFAEQCGLDPASVIMVGDSPSDLISARMSGMTALAVLTGLATRRQLAPIAEDVLDSIADLPEWLEARLLAEDAA